MASARSSGVRAVATVGSWLLYGATGYTGRLIAEEAARRGLRPILAGRSAESVQQVAKDLGLESRVFALDDGNTASIAEHLTGIRAVLNCAGPFRKTAEPLMDACLAAGVHYLDITGEIDVIEAAAARSEQAQARGISLLPAMGFDVVPSDCLAATLAQKMPDAVRLTLAFATSEGPSPGTARTALGSLPEGGRARIDGVIRRVPLAWKTREIPFAKRVRRATTIAWGDVASAYYSTGIPNIETYMADRRSARRWKILGVLLGLPGAGWLADHVIRQRFHGPTAEERARSRASLWGEVVAPDGSSLTGTLETPGGYALTVQTALGALERLLQGGVATGFQTPSQAFGADFILTFPGTEMHVPAES